MKFLVDNQLPAALSRFLSQRGHPSIHIADLGLAHATDREIRVIAAAQGCTVVSKDEDMNRLTISDPAGPALVWVRLGTCRKPALFAAFDQHLQAFLTALQSGLRVFELH